MAFDLHIAKERAQAERSMPVLSLEYEEHARLFLGAEFENGLFPLMERLWDYYRDAHFGTSELSALASELNQFFELRRDDPEIQIVLVNLLSVCGEAETRGEDLWGFCD